MSFWRQARAILYRDLRVERRSGDTLSLGVPFGVLALILFPLAAGTDATLIAKAGPAIFWLVALLFGIQATLRQLSMESQSGRDLVRMAGLDPAARFAGRSVASGLLMAVFLAILGPVMIVLYAPSPVPAWGLVIPAALLTAAGLGMLGVLAADLTTGLRSRSALAPLLVAPLSVPLLLGASQTLESLALGRSILPWTLLMIVTVLVLAVMGVVTARPLEEALR